jgi:hypothetical protein
MCNITAQGKLNNHELTDIPVLNPGDWFGKTWLIEIGGSYWPLHLVVEADTAQCVIDELAENEKFGHHVIVDEVDLGDQRGQMRRQILAMPHAPLPQASRDS